MTTPPLTIIPKFLSIGSSPLSLSLSFLEITSNSFLLPLASIFKNHPISRYPLFCNPNFLAMAARIIAQLIVMGSGLLVRAVAQAYRQALANASKSGAAQEAIQNTVRRASRAITEQEARQILGVTENATWEEVLQKYDVLFERNSKQGSFYLQSKVHHAKECLEAIYQNKGQGSTG